VSPVDLSTPTLVEGVPGVGPVGEVVADHLVERVETDRHATLLRGTAGDRRRQPVSGYLSGRTPTRSGAARSVAECLGAVLGDEVTPLCPSGTPAERAQSTGTDQ
jgi:hypothetical protein